MLRLRKHANKSAGTLADGSWPLAGVSFEDGVPTSMSLSTQVVETGIREGWIVGEGETLVTRPGGPPDDLYRTDNLHIFRHFDALTFKTTEGDYRYSVVHQPDKYADHAEASSEIESFTSDDRTPVTDAIYAAGATRVDHFYRLELEG